jgi:hypothetical protein
MPYVPEIQPVILGDLRLNIQTKSQDQLQNDYLNGLVNLINNPASNNRNEIHHFDKSVELKTIFNGRDLCGSSFCDIYFGKKNIQEIQNKLKCIMKKEFNLNIGNQDEIQLLEIMKHIYIYYSIRPTDQTKFLSEINRMNNYTINYCIPKIYNNIVSHLKYLNDISKPYTTMSNPINTSMSGMKNQM